MAMSKQGEEVVSGYTTGLRVEVAGGLGWRWR